MTPVVGRGKMNLIEYELTPGGYGQVRYHPLLLVNETNTEFEMCWSSFRALAVGLGRLTDENLSADPVALNYTYSMRTRPLDFAAVSANASRMTDICAIQEIHRIVVQALEQAHTLVCISRQKRTGQSINDYRDVIEQEQRRFHRLPLPEKLNRFTVDEVFTRYLSFIDSVTKARNALEHRRGVLGKQDCNAGGKLRVALKVPGALHAMRRHGSQSASVRTAEAKFVDDVVVFRQGDHVSFDPVTVCGIMVTANFALKGIVDWIYALNGFSATDEQGWILKQFGAQQDESTVPSKAAPSAPSDVR